MKVVLLTVRVEVNDVADADKVAGFVSACIQMGDEANASAAEEYGFTVEGWNVDLSCVEEDAS